MCVSRCTNTKSFTVYSSRRHIDESIAQHEKDPGQCVETVAVVHNPNIIALHQFKPSDVRPLSSSFWSDSKGHDARTQAARLMSVARWSQFNFASIDERIMRIKL